MNHQLNGVDLFVDMDGTIARFYERADCLERMYEPGFFSSLNMYENVVQALIKLKTLGVRIHSISALPAAKCAWVIDEKRDWISRTPLAEVIWQQTYTMPGENKAVAAGVKLDSDRIKILLDDYNKNLEEWRAAGGTPIKLVNEINDKGHFGPLWSGARVRYDWLPERIANEILLIVNMHHDVNTK